jgi:hypothetical protein
VLNPDGADIVESSIAREPTKLGTETIKAGSWIVGIRLPPDLHRRVVSGELAGFSVGGSARRLPVEE